MRRQENVEKRLEINMLGGGEQFAFLEDFKGFRFHREPQEIAHLRAESDKAVR